MNKTIVIALLIIMFGLAGFFVYQNYSREKAVDNQQPAVVLSPIFAQLSNWVPNAKWSTPVPITRDTPYGQLKGMEVKGEIRGENQNIGDDFGSENFLNEMDFTKDYAFSADGPGSSNWGFSKTTDGKMQSIVFGYSTNHLLGPENTGAPFANLSVFVSDPFIKK